MPAEWIIEMLIKIFALLVAEACGIVVMLNAHWMEFTGFWLWFSIIAGTAIIIWATAELFRTFRRIL